MLTPSIEPSSGGLSACRIIMIFVAAILIRLVLEQVAAYKVPIGRKDHPLGRPNTDDQPMTKFNPTAVSSVALAACRETDQVWSPTMPSTATPPQA